MSQDLETELLICHLSPARRRARQAAMTEVLSLLHDLRPIAQPGGPLAEQGGVFWVGLPAGSRGTVAVRLPRLGYTRAVDALEPLAAPPQRRSVVADVGVALRWRGRWYRTVRLFEADQEALRRQAVDRRSFVLETRSGDVRPVTGYRGSSGPLSRRGLPVVDARLLVNLVFRPRLGWLLDPFAGTGGIVLEARAAGWRCASADLDGALRHGLAVLSDDHVVADARALPFRSGSVAAVATEPPYDRDAIESVVRALGEIRRVLTASGSVAMLCAAWQAPALRGAAARLALEPYLDASIDRKGTEAVVLAWRTPP